jgi:hypothetical protein
MVNQNDRYQNMDNAGRQNTLEVIRVPALMYPYSAGVYGGLWSGLAMIPVALAYGILSGRGIWYPVNLIAATLLRSWQQASANQLVQFSLPGLAVGLSIHLFMAIFLGLTFAILLPTLPGSPILWAFIIGPLLWAGAIFAGLPLFNPVMAQFIDWPSFAAANIVYSLVLGGWVNRIPKVPAQ